MTSVAALYVDPRGPYPALAARGYIETSEPSTYQQVSVDCWDASRDARLYDGPHPVVAHPPCKHWSRLRHLAHVQCTGCGWSGKQPDSPRALQCPGCRGILSSDADCAPRAVEQVRRWGGVLEHPAGSLLWGECDLPTPEFPVSGGRLHGKVARISSRRNEAGEFVDDYRGYTIEINQVEWGHVARKRTWLYLVGVPREALEPPPFPGRAPSHYASGGRTASSRTGGPVPAGVKVCSAQQRRRTPPLFAEYLVRLARSVKP